VRASWCRSVDRSLCNRWGRSTRLSGMNALATAVLCAFVAGCGAPVPTAEPVAPAIPGAATPANSTAPSAPSGIRIVCPPVSPEGLAPGPGTTAWCPPEEVAVETAIARLDYLAQSITISESGFPCYQPFQTIPLPCASVDGEPTAYVTFIGTDAVAALQIASVPNGPIVATLRAFVVPPAGWVMP